MFALQLYSNRVKMDKYFPLLDVPFDGLRFQLALSQQFYLNSYY